MIRANRRDHVHWRFTAEFQALGCSVQDTSRVGSGCPDVFVGFDKRHHGCEYKTGKKGRVLHSQVMWAAMTRGCWHLITKTEDIQELVAAWRRGCYDQCGVV